jgi:hypothetical protein
MTINVGHCVRAGSAPGWVHHVVHEWWGSGGKSLYEALFWVAAEFRRFESFCGAAENHAPPSIRSACFRQWHDAIDHVCLLVI